MGKLYIIPERSNIDASLKLADEYGAHFEYNDFYSPEVLDDKQKINELIGFYRALPDDKSKNSLHGAFFDVTIHSSDKLIREISDKRIRQSMEIGSELGVSKVIFHTNIIPNFRSAFYIDAWVERNAEYWSALSADYPGISICIENMFDADPEPIVRLMEALKKAKDVSLCFDYAHATVFGNDPERWLALLLPFSTHIHLNDNDGYTDSHMAIGNGAIDFLLFDKHVRAIGNQPTVLIETSSADSQQISLKYLKKHNIYPFDWRIPQ